MLVPLQFDEALLTQVIGVLADVAEYVGLSNIPVGHHPQSDNHTYGYACNFRNVLHVEDRVRSTVMEWLKLL